MNVILWILQALLALIFTVFGGMKLLTPHEILVTKLGWAAASPTWLPTLIGVCELAGAIGLIAPGVTRVAPGLTAITAGLLGVVMLLALATHVVRGELAMALAPAVLGVLCAVVARGRY